MKTKKQENQEFESIPFESAFARLEEILEKMNSGTISLEESLKFYEEAGELLPGSEKLHKKIQ